ncbi:beta strand repeat-containing protein [Cohaesibacter haloalkalitolerans]|uniref:beta strand repeat-containing protein n=1 Tax=Cohaesibacter haloalkalitolerans TaxID=1162980 RepID=UPI000E65697B|nr:hypothetical protein [Cohaesibacter haloalkalitolerans]
MTRIRLALMATAATSAIAMAGLAYAANNEAFITQQGTNNSASVDQTNTGGTADRNKLGSASDTVLQNGSSNSLDVTQSGSDNAIGLLGDGVDQTGANNGFEALQATDGNIIGSVQQIENTAAGADGANYLRIKQQVGNANIVGSVRQETTADGENRAILRQDGAGNRIKSVSQTNNGNGTNNLVVKIEGNGNGTSDTLTNYAAINGVNGSEIIQSGSDNEIKLYITGDDNQFGATQTNLSGGTNSINTLNVEGDRNELGVSQIAHSATDANTLTIQKIVGDDNNVGVSQQGWGFNTGSIDLGDSSDNNWAYLSQRNGADADITVEDGDFNRIRIFQIGASTTNHSATISIDSSDVTGVNNEAYINQRGNGHTATTTIVGDRNYSLVYQENGYSNTGVNSITGDVNEVYIKQINGSHDDDASVSVTGDRNTVNSRQTTSNNDVLTVDITGQNNTISSTQNTTSGSSAEFAILGDANSFDATQMLGAGNGLTTTIYGNDNGMGTWSVGGAAASLLLDSGYLSQSGSGNTLALAIGDSGFNSSSNLVATMQNGDDNMINISITAGDSNEVAISQHGNANSSQVAQIGSMNIVGISQ